jgi:hypothetical protein
VTVIKKSPILIAAVAILAARTLLYADTLVPYTSRAAFGGNDSLDWGQLGLCNESLSNPFTATSAGGLSVQGSVAIGHGSTTTQRNADGSGGCAYNGWFGNFSPGDNLVWTANFDTGQGPLTLTFGSPIFGVGTQFMADFYGPFTAQIDAYNGGILLGSVIAAGDSGGAADNSAMFLGVRDLDGANITHVVLSLPTASADPWDFTINQLSLATADVTAIPEPASLVMFGTGLVSIAARRYRKTKARRLL